MKAVTELGNGGNNLMTLEVNKYVFIEIFTQEETVLMEIVNCASILTNQFKEKFLKSFKNNEKTRNLSSEESEV